MQMKKCTKCGEEKPATLEYFVKCSQLKCGLNSHCKKCDYEYNKIYRNKNIKRIKEKAKEWEQKNIDKRKEYKRQWELNNKDKKQIRTQKRINKLKNVFHDFNCKDWEKIKQVFNYKCAYCGKEDKLAQEHFIPLSKGGEYTKNNIIPSCKSCNSSKGTKCFFDWYPTYEYYSKEREKFMLEYLNYKDGIQQLSLF
jgi:5-methylcytosine-specific restriction endonuclease McrA